MQTRPHILVVDDESQITRVLRTTLSAQGYEIRVANDGETALEMVKDFAPDLVITDLAMPNMNGIELCRNLRRVSQVPILVLSVRGEERSKVEALDSGADDYITKPFSIEELLARIRVLQRHRIQPPNDRSVVEVGDLRLNIVSRTATVRGTDIRLSPREYELLQLLATHAGKVLTHRFILRQVWGNESDVQYLRIYIRSLRQKIEANPDKPATIVTMQGVGYCLRSNGQSTGQEALFRSEAGPGTSAPAVNR